MIGRVVSGLVENIISLGDSSTYTIITLYTLTLYMNQEPGFSRSLYASS